MTLNSLMHHQKVNLATTKLTKLIAVVWLLFGFWSGGRYIIPIFLIQNLYLSTVISTLISLALTSVFLILIVVRLGVIRTRMLFLIIFYYLVVFIATIISPLMNSGRLLGSLGLLTISFLTTISAIVALRFIPLQSAIFLFVRGMIPAVFISTFVLMAKNIPSISGFRIGENSSVHSGMFGVYYGFILISLMTLPVYKNRLIRYGLALVSVLALLWTASKISIGATILAIIFVVFNNKKQQIMSKLLPILSIASIAAVILGKRVYDWINLYLGDVYLISTLTGRLPLWKWIVAAVAERPILGYGFSFLRDAIDPFTASLGWNISIAQAHNAYLDSLFATGYVGLIVFFLLIFYGIFLIVKAVRIRNNNFSTYALGLCVFLIVRSVTEGLLNLGFDFLLFVLASLIAEQVLKNNIPAVVKTLSS